MNIKKVNIQTLFNYTVELLQLIISYHCNCSFAEHSDSFGFSKR